ncbi:MAG: OmpA family protein [Magnetococcales bacterium]|nr:OmpA family protein [Magnetococcales bacterium]MBF0322899.1 OmpA family protein [Magnetococcales bacterium]
MSNTPRHVIINLDGNRFLLKGRSCEPLPSLDAVKGDKWVITDFRGAPSFLMSVEAPQRYAELLAHRQLQEQGEANQHARLLTHWKQGRTANLSELFFTVVEKDAATSYFDMAQADSNHHLVFPLNAVLYDVLVKNSSKKQNVAVLFDHDRHVDILIGNPGRIAGNLRLSSHSSAPEDKANMVESLQDELRSMASKANMRLEKIIYFNWHLLDETGSATSATNTDISFGTESDGATMATIGGHLDGAIKTSTKKATSASRSALVMSAGWVRQLAEKMQLKCVVLQQTRYEQENDQVLVTSLPTAIKSLSYQRAGNTTLEIVKYGAEKAVVPFLTTFLIVVGGLYLSHLFLAQKTRTIEKQIEAEKGQGFHYEPVLPISPDSTKVVDFTKRLSSLFDMPSPRSILVEVSDSIPEGMDIHVRKLSFDYDARMTPIITMDGFVGGGFKVAKQAYTTFMQSLVKRGYVLEAESLNTDVQKINFVTKIRREHAQPKNMVILLPGDDGKVGAVSVTNKGGHQELNTAHAAVGVDDADVAPTQPFSMDQSQIQAAFGKALDANPEPPLHFILNFNSGGTDLTEESKLRMTELLGAVSKRSTPPTVEVVGHTDTVGPADRNWQLALDRSQSVRNKLVEIGLKPEMVDFSSHGEGNPLVRTADEVSESRNRRVEVTIQ